MRFNFLKWAACVLLNILVIEPILATNVTTWHFLTNGLEYALLTDYPNFPSGKIHAFRINLQYFHLETALFSNLSHSIRLPQIFDLFGYREDINPILKSSRTSEYAQVLHDVSANSVIASFERSLFYTVMSERKAVIGVNGGFFTPELKSLGLRVNQYKTLNSLKPVSWWSVFFIRNQHAEIIPYTRYQSDQSIQFAIQAGPRLIHKGQLVPQLKAGLDGRTAIGITALGKVILLSTENILISTSELAQWMLNTQQTGGLDCKEAMNLDGGHSTQLYANLPKFFLKAGGNNRVADAVLVVPN